MFKRYEYKFFKINIWVHRIKVITADCRQIDSLRRIKTYMAK